MILRKSVLTAWALVLNNFAVIDFVNEAVRFEGVKNASSDPLREAFIKGFVLHGQAAEAAEALRLARIV
jgi:hypothetical protein